MGITGSVFDVSKQVLVIKTSISIEIVFLLVPRRNDALDSLKVRDRMLNNTLPRMEGRRYTFKYCGPMPF